MYPIVQKKSLRNPTQATLLQDCPFLIPHGHPIEDVCQFLGAGHGEVRVPMELQALQPEAGDGAVGGLPIDLQGEQGVLLSGGLPGFETGDAGV